MADSDAPRQATSPLRAVSPNPPCLSATRSASPLATPRADSSDELDQAQAALAGLRLARSANDYLGHYKAAAAAWDARCALEQIDSLGAITVRAEALSEGADAVPEFTLTCERLSAAHRVASHYADLLRCLKIPGVRQSVVEKNNAAALLQTERLAASGAMHGMADHHKVANQIAMASCNESLQGFITSAYKAAASSPSPAPVQATQLPSRPLQGVHKPGPKGRAVMLPCDSGHLPAHMHQHPTPSHTVPRNQTLVLRHEEGPARSYAAMYGVALRTSDYEASRWRNLRWIKRKRRWHSSWSNV